MKKAIFKEIIMSPKIEYDNVNDLAYILYSDRKVVKSIESDDELMVFDIDSRGDLVGVEILSVHRLLEESGYMIESGFNPDMIPTYLIPKMYSCWGH